MVIIDGQELPDSALDPKQHRFIGMFRQPLDMPKDTNYMVMCSCGLALDSMKDIREHWQAGHFDLPQYLSIENAKTGPKNPGNFSENSDVV